MTHVQVAVARSGVDQAAWLLLPHRRRCPHLRLRSGETTALIMVLLLRRHATSTYLLMLHGRLELIRYLLHHRRRRLLLLLLLLLLLSSTHLNATVLVQERFAEVRHELHVVEDLCDLMGSLNFSPTLGLLALDSDLDQLGGELVGPQLALAVHMRLVVVWKHFHVLLDAEERVFDGALLDQCEKHR